MGNRPAGARFGALVVFPSTLARAPPEPPAGMILQLKHVEPGFYRSTLIQRRLTGRTIAFVVPGSANRTFASATTQHSDGAGTR